jgi:hypothetical protein
MQGLIALIFRLSKMVLIEDVFAGPSRGEEHWGAMRQKNPAAAKSRWLALPRARPSYSNERA